MRVLHLELDFPEQMEDLGDDPVLYASCVRLLGVLVLQEGFLDQVPAPGCHLHGASRILRKTLKCQFSEPLHFV